MINSLALKVVLTSLIVTWLVLLLIWDYLIYVHLYEKNLQQRVSFNYRGIRVPPLCSSRAFCTIGRSKFTRCVVILKTNAIPFIFVRMFNDDLSPRRTASVLASCTLQSAILLRTAQSIQQYGSTDGTGVIQTEHQEFCGNLWNIAHRQGMKEQRNNVLQFLDELWL